MSAMRPFPWDEAIGFGLGVLRLSPQAFWSMTPRELALRNRRRDRRRRRRFAASELADLMTRYPDGR